MIKNDKRANDLTGKEWLQNSFSIWRNLRKTPEELIFDHPATFPISLAEKLIETFSKKGDAVLDPFNGIGTTCVAANKLQRKVIGIDLSDDYCNLARTRIRDPFVTIIQGDSFDIIPTLPNSFFNLCVTSPPYWDILNMKRTADLRQNRNYSDDKIDLGNIDDYDRFVMLLGDIFELIKPKMLPRGYLLVNVMDIRKKNKFFPLHSDLANELERRGYIWDDLIIWDRQIEYNNMRPLGYPYRFRINKVHEYILIFTLDR